MEETQNQLQTKITRYKRLARLASDDQTRERIDGLVGELEQQLHASQISPPAQDLSGQR
jgi:hypothetical protein